MFILGWKLDSSSINGKLWYFCRKGGEIPATVTVTKRLSTAIDRVVQRDNSISSIEKHRVPTLASPVRIQEYGTGLFMGARTKSALKKALKKNYITVNDVIATSATLLFGGECICLTIPKENKQHKKVELELTVLFEDDYLAIIHKPAGILVSGNSFKTIANGLSQNLQQSSLPDVTIPQPVHRLDFPTTGALLVGKTSGSIRALNNLFATNQMRKTYYAVTIGEMKAHGEIISEIDGKKAQTQYRRIDTISSPRFGQLNLVKLLPETGRRHQLRIQLSAIGNPILGDKTYGKEKLILMGKGLYLHAYSLKFIHPFTHELCDVNDPLPLRFEKLFADTVTKIVAADD